MTTTEAEREEWQALVDADSLDLLPTEAVAARWLLRSAIRPRARHVPTGLRVSA